MTDTVNLGLPCIEGSQAQKHVTHNDALRILDTLVQLAVADRDLSAPPGSPAEGQRWLVGAGASGAWAGHDNAIAAWQDGGWQFSTPQTGWLAFVVDEGTLVAWNGAAWGDFFSTVTSIQNLALLGVGTTADGTNPLSAKLNNALWVAKTVGEGGDGNLRYKLSKESAAKTLSLLFQDNYSGRAEIGLTGDDDLHFKVSADGTTWSDGIVIDRASGAVTFPNTTIAGGRETLAAARTYYVRTDGSDGNNGLANTSSGAFLTVQKAIDTAAALDIAGHTVTIQIADGTYAGACVLKNVVGFATAGNLVIQGNNGTPANVAISVSAANVFSADGIYSAWDIKDLKIANAGGGGIKAANGATIRFSNLNFGGVTGAHLLADAGGHLICLSDYAVSGGASYHLEAIDGGIILSSGVTITISGTPVFGYWVYCGLLALVNAFSVTFSGSATGTRYTVFANAAIFTNGGGASYLPGDSGGSTATGGQYA